MTTIRSPFTRAHLIAYAIVLVILVLTAVVLPAVLDANRRAHQRVLNDLHEMDEAMGQFPMASGK